MTRQESGISANCEFQTARLSAKEWHGFSLDREGAGGLAEIVVAMLTEEVTRFLPASWRGPFTTESARAWIRERDEESTTLLVVDRRSEQPVGLIFLYEIPSEIENEAEFRIGYLVSESAWGQGVASEMLSGLVEWCRGQPAVSFLVGGLDRDNLASRRVLEKCGFVVDEQGEHHELYRLALRP